MTMLLNMQLRNVPCFMPVQIVAWCISIRPVSKDVLPQSAVSIRLVLKDCFSE
jgi:hypothetical protein